MKCACNWPNGITCSASRFGSSKLDMHLQMHICRQLLVELGLPGPIILQICYKVVHPDTCAASKHAGPNMKRAALLFGRALAPRAASQALEPCTQPRALGQGQLFGWIIAAGRPCSSQSLSRDPMQPSTAWPCTAQNALTGAAKRQRIHLSVCGQSDGTCHVVGLSCGTGVEREHSPRYPGTHACTYACLHKHRG